MEEHRAHQILPVQPPGQAAHQHHWLFQPLGAVDGQDGDPLPLPSGAGGGQLGPRLPQPLQTEQELKERAAAAVLQLPCQGVQGQQVVLPLLPTGHGPEQAQQIGLFVDVPDQLPAGALTRAKAQLLQLGQEVPARLIAPPGRFGHRGIEVPFGPRPKEGQLIPVKAKHRGAQSGNQGHILPGVVHDLEQRQSHIHLCGVKEVPTAVGGPGDALLAQRPEIVVQHHAWAAQQDHHIRGAQRPRPLPVLHHQGPVQKRPDPPGGPPGLQAVLVLPLPLLLLPQQGQVQHVQLQGVILPRREGRPGDQSLVIGVVHLTEIPGHHRPEQVVAALQHLGAGAEVPGEHAAAGLPGSGLLPVPEAAVFVQKDGGVGQSEAVDGLLHIPHLKKRTPPV